MAQSFNKPVFGKKLKAMKLVSDLSVKLLQTVQIKVLTNNSSLSPEVLNAATGSCPFIYTNTLNEEYSSNVPFKVLFGVRSENSSHILVHGL